MKLTLRFGAGALALALLSGCEAMNKTKSEATNASDSNSTAKNPGQTTANIDPTANVKVTTPYANWPKDGAGLKQGWWVSKKTSGTGYSNESRWAVVAVAGDVMKLEITGEGSYNTPKDYILALTVSKSGDISYAGVGKKGEKPKELKVDPAAKVAAPDAPAPTDEDVTVKAGTFKSKKTVFKYPGGESVSWLGVDGDVKDVMLKSSSAGSGFELAEVPTTEDWSVSGKTFKVKHVKYTNGQEQWTLPESWPFVSTLAKMVASGATIEITGTGEDAKPDLNWEGVK